MATMFLTQPGTEVEEEAVAVAQFDHDAGASLIAPYRDGATANERYPHLVSFPSVSLPGK